MTPAHEAAMREMQRALEAGMSPQQVADCVFEAIRAQQFYILTHPEYNPAIRARMESILGQSDPPTLR